MKINVGVIYGGNSTEHEISVITAVQAMKNMDKDKYNIIPIYISKDGVFYTSERLKNIDIYRNLEDIKKTCKEVLLTKKNNQVILLRPAIPYNIIKTIDIAFPILHGYNTEDGTIAGLLEVLEMPYAESDIYASVIAQDKVFQKALLKQNGVAVVDYVAFYESDFEEDEESILKEIKDKLDYPVIIKPSRGGSSVGISVAKNKIELIDAIEEALEYDEKVLVEKVVENMKELNISVLGDNHGYETSLIEEVYGSDEILSYKDKYMSSNNKKTGTKTMAPSKGMASTGRMIPADIDKKVKEDIESYAKKACKVLNTSGVVRIDFLYDTKKGKVYLNELNITPGSLSFYLWTASGMEYNELLDRVIELGIKKYQNKEKKAFSIETNVLKNFNGLKAVKK